MVERLNVLHKDAIVIGQNITSNIVKETLETVIASWYVIVSDFNIASHGHLDKLAQAFEQQISSAASQPNNTTSKVLTLTIPPGESVKTREMKSFIEDFMFQNKCTRDSCLIALGGGVIGDMIGYVASTFMRGIPVIQIPTTLLAMVDSSVGGKTAVDTPHGKNLIGAFHQPTRIFMDIDYLKTLPKREFVNGLAEVIKTAAIWSEQDFEHLETFTDQILNTQLEYNEALVNAIVASVKTKAHVVTVDEKETGLRGLLNFGHTLGHAIEAILAPQILHGECVAVGMILESEISRNLGHLKDTAVGRLTRCLQAFGLPNTLNDKKIKQHCPHKECSVDQIMDYMKLDKKNKGNQKRMVLLKSIGQTVEPKASFVQDQVIKNILSPSVFVSAASACPFRPGDHTVLNVPGSKSISNRALVLAALGKGDCRIQGLLNSDDVQVMLNALQKLVSIQYRWEDEGDILVITGGKGRLSAPSSEMYLGNAGTASRFLTSVCALIQGQDAKHAAILTGNARMKQRPIGPLVDALRNNGCEIEYLESKGSLPLKITPTTFGLKGGEIHLSASISSQYVSSILMAAPYASEPVRLVLDGDDVVSQPYIDMTIAMMASFGVQVKRLGDKNIYYIPKKVYMNPSHYQVEADASSATYPLAFAAITGSKVTVSNIGSQSLQGDAQFAVKVLAPMGCKVEQSNITTTVQGPRRLKPIPSIDMETMTDAFLTASVLAAVACDQDTGKTKNTTHIYGISNQRVKECDRIHAMVEQLEGFGVYGKEFDDGLEVYGVSDLNILKPPHGGVKCYDDHRVAMSFSLLCCAMPTGKGAVVNEKKCVEKTWPGWWDTLERILGISIQGAENGLHHSNAVKSSSSATPKRNLITWNAFSNVNVSNNNDSSYTKSIVLIGMRGVGKTHAGQALAKSLNRVFIDMDHYLEKQLNATIPNLIEQKGWEYFRAEESRLLDQVLEQNSQGAVIACGGGVVEASESRSILKKWCGRQDNAGLELAVQSFNKVHVIHLKRDMKQVVEYLSKDTSRPSFGQDILAVWEKRKPLYQECSSSEFQMVLKDNSPKEWELAERSLINNVVALQDYSKLRSPSDMKYFLSLTFGNVLEAKEVLPKIVQGVDAVELRVDLLKSWEYDFVIEQVCTLKNMLLEVRREGIPIIFTVRTTGQGGNFPDDKWEDMLSLLKGAVRCGCEFIDVEVYPKSKGHEDYESQVASLAANKGINTKIIASYHDVKGEAIWHLQTYTSLLSCAALGQKSKLNSVKKLDHLMQSFYQKLSKVGDIVKLISRANEVADNICLQEFINEITNVRENKPLIAINMGPMGQITRVRNQCLTPVTHHALPSAAAPGQLTIQEIGHGRFLTGELLKKGFYLFGEPISHSMSPTLHNTAFNSLGLPYHYRLFETSDAQKVKDFLKSKLDQNVFGGASVTIPLKESVMPFVDELTDAAKSIGSINTISVYQEGGSSVKLWGDNTDWIGMKNCIEDKINKNSFCRRVGLVFGAGGTARAACYTLKQIGCDKIYLWNRTESKGRQLAHEMGCEFIPSLSELTSSLSHFSSTSAQEDNECVYFTINTVPGNAQDLLDTKSISEFIHSMNPKGVFVEMAMNPINTPLKKIFIFSTSRFDFVPGIDVLLAQGYEQLQRWTSVHPPHLDIQNKVYENYYGK